MSILNVNSGDSFLATMGNYFRIAQNRHERIQFQKLFCESIDCLADPSLLVEMLQNKFPDTKIAMIEFVAGSKIGHEGAGLITIKRENGCHDYITLYEIKPYDQWMIEKLYERWINNWVPEVNGVQIVK